MSKSVQVGTSGRTPAKHTVMRALLGQQSGALRYVANRLGVEGMMFIDATAGDGGDLDSSPILVQRYSGTVARSGLRVEAHLFERDRRTFESLQSNLAEYPTHLHFHHDDARITIPSLDRQGLALTLLDDPNDSGASTLTETLCTWAFSNPATTIFASIGANANGIARRAEHYEESLERYLALLAAAKRERIFRRAVTFCRLDGDAHRWGYLIVGSQRFEPDVKKALSSAMGEVETSHGGKTRRIHGLVYSGFEAVEAALIEQHQPRKNGNGGKPAYSSYREYLQHPRFLAIRAKVLSPDTVCEECGIAWATEVHHLQYPKWGEFDVPGNLLPVCHRCHCKLEGKEN